MAGGRGFSAVNSESIFFPAREICHPAVSFYRFRCRLKFMACWICHWLVVVVVICIMRVSRGKMKRVYITVA